MHLPSTSSTRIFIFTFNKYSFKYVWELSVKYLIVPVL